MSGQLLNANIAIGAPTLLGAGARALTMPQQLADEQFLRWSKLLEARTGIVLPLIRKDFLATNLRARMREVGATHFDDYFASVSNGPKAAVEWATLVDRLTVHQTHFFRHLPSFACVAEWLDARFAQVNTVSAWSVGCSTGEEAYSLAMQIETCGQKTGRRVQYGVSGTDVSQLSLVSARRAQYGHFKEKEIPVAMTRFIKPNGADNFEVIEELKRRVAFSPFNLLDIARVTVNPFDLIFCQNVLIYFSRERRAELLHAFAKLLNPGGLLIIGPGEVTNINEPLLTRVEYKNVLGFHKTDVLRSHAVFQ
jgi:type IV pilus assembly protein PilK